MAERFGPAMRHRIEPVERIDPDPSGKYRFAIYAVEEAGRVAPPVRAFRPAHPRPAAPRSRRQTAFRLR